MQTLTLRLGAFGKNTTRSAVSVRLAVVLPKPQFNMKLSPVRPNPAAIKPKSLWDGFCVSSIAENEPVWLEESSRIV